MIIGRFIDITDQVFGRLTVVAPTDQRDSGSVKWLCRCKCGTETLVSARNLKSGAVQSCGCLQKERVKERGKKNKKYNVFETQGDVSIGYTKAGIKFLIDAEDLDRVIQHCWHVDGQGYICSDVGGKNVLLHRFVLSITDERITDHINRNKTDNRKKNLRIVTRQQNNMNRGIPRNNTTGTKGVYKSKNGKYVAQIRKDRRLIHLGTYDTLEEARQVRIEKEIELFGEFAYQYEEGGD